MSSKFPFLNPFRLRLRSQTLSQTPKRLSFGATGAVFAAGALGASVCVSAFSSRSISSFFSPFLSSFAISSAKASESNSSNEFDSSSSSSASEPEADSSSSSSSSSASTEKVPRKKCRVCDDQRSYFDEMRRHLFTSALSPADSKSSTTDKENQNATEKESIEKKSNSLSEKTEQKDSNAEKYCSPDYMELSHSSWTFLHSTAAHYPEKPDLHTRRAMEQLIHSVSFLYPCEECAGHLKEYLKKHPIERASGNNRLLNQWICEMHNDVNKRLGKPAFDCSKVLLRWRDGEDC